MLRIDDLNLNYGPVLALRGVSLHIDDGEIVSLLGANGAGKTSLLRAISGLEKVASGNIRFQGRSVVGVKPHLLVPMGIAHSPEGRHIFPDLTVAENLDMGAFIISDKAIVAQNRERVFHYFPILAERQQQKGGSLSGGEQQMLAVGRALMSSPKLLMLDEPSLGLAPKIIDQIFAIIRQVNREEKVTIFLVEQNANEALLHSDRAYILEQGVVSLEGASSELIEDERVRDAYLGV